LLGGEIRSSVERAREGIAAPRGALGLRPRATAEGILEIAAWNQANAIQQVIGQARARPRDYTLVAFGGSGPLLAGRLLGSLQLRAALIPLHRGNVSALRAAHGRSEERLRADVRTAP
jgi:N-methylhydantoinase A